MYVVYQRWTRDKWETRGRQMRFFRPKDSIETEATTWEQSGDKLDREKGNSSTQIPLQTGKSRIQVRHKWKTSGRQLRKHDPNPSEFIIWNNMQHCIAPAPKQLIKLYSWPRKNYDKDVASIFSDYIETAKMRVEGKQCRETQRVIIWKFSKLHKGSLTMHGCFVATRSPDYSDDLGKNSNRHHRRTHLDNHAAFRLAITSTQLLKRDEDCWGIVGACHHG